MARKGERPLDATFGVLRGRANGSGGFGLWASTPDTAEFPTVYAAHFLVEARDRGQAIPQDLLGSVNGWLSQFASTPAPTLEAGRLRAYAVYLLARQGIKPPAALANVEQELTNRHADRWKTDLAAAYVAADLSADAAHGRRRSHSSPACRGQRGARRRRGDLLRRAWSTTRSCSTCSRATSRPGSVACRRRRSRR